MSSWISHDTHEKIKKILQIAAPAATISGLILYYKYGAVEHDSIPPPPLYSSRPFFGHILAMKEAVDNCDLYDKMVEMMELNDHRPYALAVPGPGHYVFITDPLTVNQTFTEDFKQIEKSNYFREIFHEFLGGGIFTADGDVWWQHRKAASKLMTVRSLSDKMFGIFCETSQVMVDRMSELCTQSDGIDLQDIFLRVTLDSFVQIAFGVTLGATASFPGELPFSKSFDREQEIIDTRFLRPMWKLERFLGIGEERELKGHNKTLNDFCKRVIMDRRRERAEREASEPTTRKEEDGTQFHDLIDWFLENDETSRISGKELRDITLNFIIAGRDTTGLLCSWTVYELTRHPEILAKVREEMHSCADMSHKSFTGMKYTEAVLWETLRLHPSVPVLARVAKNDVPLKAHPGMVLRKGNWVSISVYAMGRSSRLWEDPLEFRPERFLNENGTIKKFDPATLPVFNLKPRVCLGINLALLEARVMLSFLFKNFDVDIVFDENNQPDRIPYTFAPILKMKYGLKSKLTKLT